ncbi:hypothetical protein [[Clostridium] innocuum]|uniref:hypothetical protein n=2 Tax=Bacillota TaxID=1239 RepID=UPI001E3E66DC|nr:hypothetical protein [[Clostridium] innocuum]MDU1018779.1 hypothetical protein [Bifidobacterium breve]MCC2831842.1 hypothetical protein [[Clostridium] innocuum]MCR0248558.1 hypothetical protein [[Clostridium] innocuum]MCR0261069.1 hypothetical protein [[Clostridium] innocuum]MCR0391763.1 hypothetical protein [[Clostridium] innocuum]
MSNSKLKKSAIFFRNYLESQDYLKLLQFDLIQLLESSGFFYGFDYSLKGRYKTPQSIIEKIDRKGYKEMKQLTDLMGVSIVCRSQEDVPKIQHIINDHFKCVEISDYYKHTPKSGYTALHMDIKYKTMPVEIQIKDTLSKIKQKYVHDRIYKSDLENKEMVNAIFVKKIDEIFSKRKITSLDEYLTARDIKKLDKELSHFPQKKRQIVHSVSCEEAVEL